MLTPNEFLAQIAAEDLSIFDRVIGLLYLVGATDQSVGMTARELSDCLRSAGYAQQNVSRLNAALQRDRRTVKVGASGWRLSPKARLTLAGQYSFITVPKALPQRDSLLPHGIFGPSRGYVCRVVEQLNQSYELGLYDCTAVMCRRLLETLIIETYEHAGRAADLHGADGHFMMLNGLLSVLEKDKAMNISRNGLKGLRDFKVLGDLSAHNRRFNAQRSDLERIRDGLRVSCEELLHLSQLHSSVHRP